MRTHPKLTGRSTVNATAGARSAEENTAGGSEPAPSRSASSDFGRYANICRYANSQTDARQVRMSGLQVCVTVVAALGAVLAVTNTVLFERNRALQGEIGSRAQFIQQSVQLEALNREIVNAIAGLAVRNKDDALKTILIQQGITFNVGQPESAGAAPSQAPEAKGRR